jgi:anti-sigma factor RsiW
MNCREAEALVEAYADGEIGGFRAGSIERHLRACAACATRHQDVLALRARLRAEVPRFQAPPALRARAEALLAGTRAPAARPPADQPRDRGRWFATGALAGCAASLLAWWIGNAAIDWRSGEDIALAAAAVHTRATLEGRLIEVASSDRHTVKPWLSARLDYSPPVQDLAGEGFPLSGGRIETLDGQRVATLVYHYRLHEIDVFVRPEPAPAPSAPRTVRGFHIAHATGSGMDWLAVSDVSPDVLAAFVERLARGDSAP